MKLGSVVEKERRRRGLSRRDVARTLGLSVNLYEALEAGDHGSLDDVAMLLVNFDDLLVIPSSAPVASIPAS